MARFTTSTLVPRRPTTLAVAAWLCLQATSVGAQSTPAPAPTGGTAPGAAPSSTELQPVTVTGQAAPNASVSGWGDIPLARTPIQASITTSAQLRDAGLQRLSDLTRVDPGVSDAYNAEGYWDFLTIRGYVIDNRFNFRRDGLPINAETSIPLDNKAQIEILKGTSGMQAGTSAPGGIVNYVVKRPLDAPLRSAFLEWRQPGTYTASVDLSQRFGVGDAFGVRLNAAAAHLDPMVRDSTGHRSLFALAADWRVSTETLLEAEIETSHQAQPSQPGLSLLGDAVPSPDNPRVNLNDQPWSQPVVFGATTASLRWRQKLAGDWRFVAYAATQQLRTDDRLAYPSGCTASDGTYYPDRYCPDGTFDLYDFRSENERRRSDALDLSVQGGATTGPVQHALTAGVLQSRVRNRFQGQAYNYVGTGNIEGTAVTPPDPTLGDQNTNRDEHSTELYLRDSIALTERLSLWLGGRYTRLHRESVRTDGSRPSDYRDGFVSPFAALSAEFVAGQFVYASWGRGVESNVVPNRSLYTNAGDVYTTPSRQAEAGWKGAVGQLAWNLAFFDIRQPRTQDFDVSAAQDRSLLTTRLDGTQHHRGVEATGSWPSGPFRLDGGAQWLRARVEGSADPTIDGREPVNVPARTLKLRAAYDVPAVPGLTTALGLVTESRRQVLPDNSVQIPAWTRLDADLRWRTRVAGSTVVWRAGVDNLLDRHAWRESPYQYSHVYLYPLLPRTWRLSAQIDL